MHEPRTRDGYATIATAQTLRAVECPQRRAELIRQTLTAIEALEADVTAARTDTALELHDRLRLTWDRVAARFGMPIQTLYRAATIRRAAHAIAKTMTVSDAA